MTCPLEKRFAILLADNGIAYTRPEADRRDPTNLDFYLPELELYIEIKRSHSDRIAAQLRLVPTSRPVMVLQGRGSIDAFLALVKRLR